jgi:hypothetical protein
MEQSPNDPAAWAEARAQLQRSHEMQVDAAFAYQEWAESAPLRAAQKELQRKQGALEHAAALARGYSEKVAALQEEKAAARRERAAARLLRKQQRDEEEAATNGSRRRKQNNGNNGAVATAGREGEERGGAELVNDSNGNGNGNGKGGASSSSSSSSSSSNNNNNKNDYSSYRNRPSSAEMELVRMQNKWLGIEAELRGAIGELEKTVAEEQRKADERAQARSQRGRRGTERAVSAHDEQSPPPPQQRQQHEQGAKAESRFASTSASAAAAAGAAAAALANAQQGVHSWLNSAGNARQGVRSWLSSAGRYANDMGKQHTLQQRSSNGGFWAAPPSPLSPPSWSPRPFGFLPAAGGAAFPVFGGRPLVH